MRRNILLLMLTFIFLLTVTSVKADESLGTFKLNSCINLMQTCDNCTYVNVSTVISPVNTTIYNLNGAMTKISFNLYTYNFCNTSMVGVYKVTGAGDVDGVKTPYAYSFTITRSGNPLMSENLIIFVWILFCIAGVGSFLMFFLTIAKLATSSETVYGVLLTWSFFILLIIVYYVSQDMVDNFIFNMTGNFITWLVWSNGVLPVISLIITMFIKGTQKKNVLSIQEFSGFKYG